MITKRFQSASRLFIATVALAGMALAVASAPPADAAGLRNCVDISGPQSGQVGCYELVWADGVEYRMTFSNQQFAGATPHELDSFYVLAPQSGTPQGAPPNTFPHDHVVRDVPAQNHGSYSVQLQFSSSSAVVRASARALACRPGRPSAVRIRSRSPRQSMVNR
jgi:hypothetical protein